MHARFFHMQVTTGQRVASDSVRLIEEKSRYQKRLGWDEAASTP